MTELPDSGRRSVTAPDRFVGTLAHGSARKDTDGGNGG